MDDGLSRYEEARIRRSALGYSIRTRSGRRSVRYLLIRFGDSLFDGRGGSGRHDMGTSWDGPKWRQEGRTGPGAGAPRYKKAKDRAAVRRGGSPGDGKGCCYWVEAGKAVWAGKFKLAARYMRFGLRALAI